MTSFAEKLLAIRTQDHDLLTPEATELWHYTNLSPEPYPRARHASSVSLIDLVLILLLAIQLLALGAITDLVLPHPRARVWVSLYHAVTIHSSIYGWQDNDAGEDTFSLVAQVFIASIRPGTWLPGNGHTFSNTKGDRWDSNPR